MPSTIHVLRALVESNVKGFARNMGIAARSTRDLRRSWSDAGAAIASSAKRIGAAVAAMGTTVAVTFGKFESTMTRAGAVTRTIVDGQMTEGFRQLEAKAREMGETTVFSASQAAEAIEVMGLAGLKTQEIVNGLDGALQLAAAGSVDIATAANVAAKTMRAFGAEASELTRINDVLVGTFTRANTDILQLSEALKPVAPVSNSLRVSLEDTAAVLAKMSDAGFQGSIAGTSLRNILSRLAGSVPAATKKLRELGVETLDASGKMRPLFEILKSIESAGLTEAELLQIFGARGGPQLLAILEAGVDNLQKFSDELKEMGGIAASIAEAQLNTLQGSFMLLRSQVESFLIDVGEDVAPVLREAAASIQEFLKQNKAEIVAQMSAAISGLARTFTAIIKRSDEFIPKMLKLASVFGRVLGAALDLAASHPNITAWLAAFKIASLFGITNALSALTSATVATTAAILKWATGTQTVTAALAAMKSGLTLANVATIAWKGSLVALWTFGMVKLAEAIYEANDAIQEFNKQQKRAAKLSNELTQIKDRQTQKTVKQGLAIQDAEKQQRFFENAVERARKESKGLQATIGRQKELVKNLSSTWKEFTGNKILEDEKKVLEELNQSLDEQKQRVRDLREAKARAAEATVKQAKAEQKRTKQQHEQQADEQKIVVEQDLEAEMEERARRVQAIQDRIEQERVSARDRQTPGFAQFRDILGMEGINRGEVTRLMGLQEGVSPGLAARAGQQFAKAQTPQDLDRIAEGIAKTVNETKRLEQAQEQSRPAIKRFAEMLRGLKDNEVLPDDEIQEFAGQANKLKDQLLDGKIGLDEFSQGMQKLTGATKHAVGAAKAKEEQELREAERKQREALLRGDFAAAGLDPRKALRDRLIQFRMQQFNAGVDQAFQRFARLNGLIPNVNQGFQALRGGMDRFGSQMQRAGSQMNEIATQVDPRQAAEAFAKISSFLSSRQGVIANIKHNIQFAQQRLQVLDSARDRMRVQEQIAGLMGQLRQLLQPTASPVSSVNPLAGVFRDPGLATGPGGFAGGAGKANITVNFSSVARPTPEDQRQIMDAMEEELARRGFRG